MYVAHCDGSRNTTCCIKISLLMRRCLMNWTTQGKEEGGKTNNGYGKKETFGMNRSGVLRWQKEEGLIREEGSEVSERNLQSSGPCREARYICYWFFTRIRALQP